MAERVTVRNISLDEGQRLLRMVRRSAGLVVTWRRAQMVLLSAQGMDVAGIAKVTFTSDDRVRDVIHNFNADGFDSLRPKYAGGRPPTFTLAQRQQIKKMALSRTADHELPFSTWSLAKLADFLVAEGVVDDISHEGLRLLLREEGVSFQAVKTWKTSTDPDYETKKNRVLELYAIADGRAQPGSNDPTVVFCMDEFGPLNLQPHPGRQWAPRVTGSGSTAAPRRRRRRATYTRPHGVRHLLAGYDLSTDRLYGHVKTRKSRTEFLSFCAVQQHDRLARAEIVQHQGRAARAHHPHNVETRGVDLLALVGRQFRIGEVVLRGNRACEPCRYLDRVTGQPAKAALAGRGGLRATVITGGAVRVGDLGSE